MLVYVCLLHKPRLDLSCSVMFMINNQFTLSIEHSHHASLSSVCNPSFQKLTFFYNVNLLRRSDLDIPRTVTPVELANNIKIQIFSGIHVVIKEIEYRY